MIETVTGESVNLVYLSSVYSAVTALLGLHAVGGKRLIDRVLGSLSLLRAIAFIGKKDSVLVRATVSENPDGTANLEPLPDEVLETFTGWTIWFGLRRSREVLFMQTLSGEEYYAIRTTELEEAGPRVYAPIALLSLAWLTTASAVQPSWLLAPFEPWLWMASQWSSIHLGWSAIGHVILGLLLFTLAWLTSFLYLTLTITAVTRALAGFADYLQRRGGMRFGFLMTFLVLLDFVTASTAY